MDAMVKATKDAVIEYIKQDAQATDAFVADVYALLLTVPPDILTDEQRSLRGNLIDRSEKYLRSGT